MVVLKSNPTTKMTALNHNKNGERWELKLSIAQTIMFLGLVLGTVTLSFVLGYFSGRSAGIHLAMERTATSQTKIPISSDPTDQNQVEISEQVVDEVYDRLRDKAVQDKAPDPVTTNDVPALGAIQEAENKSDREVEAPAVEATQSVEQADKAKAEIEEVWDTPEKSDKIEKPTPFLGSKTVASAAITAVALSTPAVSPPTPTSLPMQTPTKTIVSALSQLNEKTKEKDKTIQLGEAAEGAKVLRGVIPQGWYAQVAAPSSNSEAEGLASQLRSNGFHVVIENAQVRGEVYYRILVGPESNRQQAEVLVDQLKRESYIKSEPFIKMVR